MTKERDIEIVQAYRRIVKPWLSLGLELPPVSVKELAREVGLSNPANLANQLMSSVVAFGVNGRLVSKLVLQDSKGQNVENLDSAAKEVAPFKRAMRQADYRSRAPGGGPVVKRRVDNKSFEQKLLQLGKEKLSVGIVVYDEDRQRQKKREEAKKRLEIRWVGKSSVERDPIAIQVKKVFSFIKKISEKKGLTNGDELLNRFRLNIEIGQPQTVLVVWGPPYENQGCQNVFEYKSPEEDMARNIINVVSQLDVIVQTRLIILYADYYGTDINGIPSSVVENYGRQIKSYFKSIGELISWAELKKQNLDVYKNLRDNLPVTYVLSPEEVSRAIFIQRKLGNVVTDSQARRIAMMYRRERTIEGTMLLEGFNWEGNRYNYIIKLGTAPNRLNDELYEPELPRFYVSGMPRAAWNRSR